MITNMPQNTKNWLLYDAACKQDLPAAIKLLENGAKIITFHVTEDVYDASSNKYVKRKFHKSALDCAYNNKDRLLFAYLVAYASDDDVASKLLSNNS